MADLTDDPIWSARAHLFDELWHGRIDPTEAERLAAQQGLEPLNELPERTRYDPNSLSWWTISMTVAWIAWRDLDRVLDNFDAYRSECHDWEFKHWRTGTSQGKGWQLKRKPSATVERLLTCPTSYPDDGRPSVQSVPEAQRLLWSAAAERRLVAEAVRERDGEWVQIHAPEWESLEAVEDQNEEVLALTDKLVITAHYRKVRFARTNVLQIWPALGDARFDNSAAKTIVRRSKLWRPLHVAIAWTLTCDEQFCANIAANDSAAQRIFCASAQLEHEMIEAGCFKVVNEIMQLDPPTRTVEIQTHRLVPGYTGRFRRLAEDYELRGRRDYTDSIAQLPHAPESACNRVSLGDYLLGRWVEMFPEIMAHVSDGAISARGVAVDGNVRMPAGEMPAACVTDAMWIDLHGTVWEGPQPATSFDEKPRQWIEISVNWDETLVCFPAHASDEVQPKISNETDTLPMQPASSSKRGRKPHSYWDAVKPIVMKKLDDDGLPDAQSGDPSWCGQADLERYIADEVAKRLGSAQTPPAESTVREWAVKWIAEFGSARSAEGR